MSAVRLGPSPHQVTRLGLNAYKPVREDVERVLVGTLDISTWIPADMPGINLDFMCHKLALLPQAKPILQRKRKPGDERREAMKIEVVELAKAGFIREVV